MTPLQLHRQPKQVSFVEEKKKEEKFLPIFADAPVGFPGHVLHVPLAARLPALLHPAAAQGDQGEAARGLEGGGAGLLPRQQDHHRRCQGGGRDGAVPQQGN